MKAIVLHAKNDLRYEDVADVSITKSTQVLVKMLYGGICGSDKHYYSLGANGSFEVKHPFVLGHEGSGIVEEVGSDVKSVKKGDMVVFRPALACGHCKFCNKGMYRYCENATHFGSASTMPHTPGIFSEYAVAEEVQCLKVVDVDPKVAALAEPLSVAFAGAHALGNIMGRNVAVMGAGPVGTLCALAIKSLGVKSVTVFDVRNAPLEACKKAGLENVCNTLEEAKAGVREIMEDKKFGAAGNTMVVEEFMTGREVSVLSFVDGKTIRIMSSAQDHKRAKDGDQGLNTGGMGNFSPSPFYTKEVDEFCQKYIYQATVDAMAAEGRPFTGVIFFGLMLTEDGPKVLEYNARFGDPEAQVVLPRMKNDIIDVMEACVEGKLDSVDMQFEDNAAVCVVLASDGYPVAYEKGFEITGLEKFDGKEDYYCFHAGTKFDEAGKIVTNGGRVLGVTALGSDLKEARAKAYEATEWVDFANKYMRHDIGKSIE